MPGRTARQADDAFLGPLRRALSCITDVQFFVSPPAPARALLLSGGDLTGGDLKLRSGVVGGGLLLRIRQQFRSVHDLDAVMEERWHVSTVAYDYRVSRVDDDRELLSWHWHPRGGVSFRHLHVGADWLNRRLHVPSGRVSIEAVLRMLLGELAVPPKGEDWADVLAETEARFVAHDAGTVEWSELGGG
jgi:hypothetical protein